MLVHPFPDKPGQVAFSLSIALWNLLEAFVDSSLSLVHLSELALIWGSEVMVQVIRSKNISLIPF